MGCCPEDLPRAMNDREEWRERVRDIRATSAIWCWWWWVNIWSKRHLYSHAPPISQTMLGTVGESKNKLISDVLLWTCIHEHSTVCSTSKTYIDQLWADTGCQVEDLPRATTDRDGWQEWERERERESQGSSCYRHDLMIIKTYVHTMGVE